MILSVMLMNLTRLFKFAGALSVLVLSATALSYLLFYLMNFTNDIALNIILSIAVVMPLGVTTMAIFYSLAIELYRCMDAGILEVFVAFLFGLSLGVYGMLFAMDFNLVVSGLLLMAINGYILDEEFDKHNDKR